MSLYRIIKLLNALGFSSLEAKVYIYIAKLGPLSNEDIASRVEITLEQLVPILEALVKKGVISPTVQNQLVYNALSFEQLLDELIKSEIDQTQKIENTHQQLISLWKNTLKINEE